MATKDKLNKYALYFIGALLIIGSLGTATTSGIWNDETVANTITQDNTSLNVCMGDTCYTGWQVSISDNASIADSQICTADNGLCDNIINNTGEPKGNDGNIQYKNGTNFNGTDDLHWTGSAFQLPYTSLGTPSIQFNNNSVGIGAPSQGYLTFIINGNLKWLFTQDGLQAWTGSTPALNLLTETASKTNPIYVTNADTSTGIGFDANGDTLNLIEDSTNILEIDKTGMKGATQLELTTHSIGEQALDLKGTSGQLSTIMDVYNGSGSITGGYNKDGHLYTENGGIIKDNSTCVIILSPGGTEHTFCD